MKNKRLVATTIATAALASGAALAFAGPAAASTHPAKNPLIVCAEGTYDAYVVLPDRGGLASTNVKSGTCMSFDFGSSRTVENIEVRGYLEAQGPADAPTEFPVATGKWRPSKGGTVTALGTIEHRTAHFPLL